MKPNEKKQEKRGQKEFFTTPPPHLHHTQDTHPTPHGHTPHTQKTSSAQNIHTKEIIKKIFSKPFFYNFEKNRISAHPNLINVSKVDKDIVHVDITLEIIIHELLNLIHQCPFL